MTLPTFLRGLRSRRDPAALGLPQAGVRRVPGLRREEVAVLTGISVDYYTRLEQGRERNPSAQVAEALARGLDLSDDERQHLFRVSGLVPDPRPGPAHPPPHLTRLLDRWTEQPAFVLSPTLELLVRNELAAALFAPFVHGDLARMVFLDPAAEDFYPDWPRVAEATVASLRQSTTAHPTARSASLLGELVARSEPFARLWEQQQVRGKTHEVKRLRHPEVGALVLDYQAFDVREAPGQQLVVYSAEPGSETARALALLGTIAASRRGEARTAARER